MPKKKMTKSEIPLAEKPLLTLQEASIYTGIGVNKLRALANKEGEMFVLYVGTKRLFKRQDLIRYLMSSDRI